MDKFIYFFNKYLLNFAVGTVMGNGDSAVNKLKICSAFMEFTFQ